MAGSRNSIGRQIQNLGAERALGFLLRIFQGKPRLGLLVGIVLLGGGFFALYQKPWMTPGLLSKEVRSSATSPALHSILMSSSLFLGLAGGAITLAAAAELRNSKGKESQLGAVDSSPQDG